MVTAVVKTNIAAEMMAIIAPEVMTNIAPEVPVSSPVMAFPPVVTIVLSPMMTSPAVLGLGGLGHSGDD
jgi:hypothetical protein